MLHSAQKALIDLLVLARADSFEGFKGFLFLVQGGFVQQNTDVQLAKPFGEGIATN